ncbi:hypothetical protein HYY74_03685 [Candidatus Woesearchaeota archaeon]|nr:hypothetical protein [Candidatus Woesearchaeota archaeon]
MGMYRVLSLPHREDYDIVRRKTNTPVLAQVRMSGRLFLTPTYLEQLQQGALMVAVADPKNLAVLASEYPRQARAEAEQELQAAEQEHGKLQAQADRLSNDRASPFTDYIGEHPGRNFDYHNFSFAAGATAVARAAVEALRSEHGKQQVPSEWKSLIENYIKTGEISRENLEWLQGKMPLQFGVYNKLEKAQLEAERLRKGVEHYAALEEGMERSLEGLIRGGQNGEVAAIYDRAVEEAIQSGLAGEVLMPYRYDNKKGVPEPLADQFLPAKRMGHIITLLDYTLTKMVEAYSRHNKELGSLIDEMGRLYNVHSVRGMMVRPLLPENCATEFLYPDWRIRLDTKSCNSVEKIMGIVREAGDAIPEAVAQEYGLSADEACIAWVRQTLGEIMPTLPLDIYWLIAVNAFYGRDVSAAARGEFGHDRAIGKTLGEYKRREQNILRDFGITAKSATEPKQDTLGCLIELFGANAEFIGKLVELKPSHNSRS